ncbi:MAG: tryptophan--tRNA ligase [Candidatus Pacebacteria bacterium]|jgi:tryptophanyl-tRNA synthetase|nr:tryptophan--tRNA ligase [Candidatus Paceibacterota bacterium]
MRIFSGIRPTGDIHLGNYLGAIKQWVDLQNQAEPIFCVVDMHAVTTPYDPKKLQGQVFELAIDYLAAGLDPDKCILFVQSHVKEHCELAWLLGTVTPMGELKRMTQFKDKSKQHPEYVNAGLFNYPVLMAADILLYKTDAVPIGKDQEQHVELTRAICRYFNNQFGPTLKEPKSMVPEAGAKIMSLTEPDKKMSKTGNPKGCIGVFEEPESIAKKIASAVTDTGREIKFDVKRKPGIANLLTINSLASQKPIEQLEAEFSGKSYSEFKKATAQALIDYLEPLRKKRKELLTREVYVNDILRKGASKSQTIASQTMREVKSAMGLEK